MKNPGGGGGYTAILKLHIKKLLQQTKFLSDQIAFGNEIIQKSNQSLLVLTWQNIYQIKFFQVGAFFFFSRLELFLY